MQNKFHSCEKALVNSLSIVRVRVKSAEERLNKQASKKRLNLEDPHTLQIQTHRRGRYSLQNRFSLMS